MSRADQLARYFREQYKRIADKKIKHSPPQWFIHALVMYRRNRGNTFTKQQLRWFIRSVMKRSIADETVARYIRYAVESGYVKPLREKGKGVYLIVFSSRPSSST